MNIDIVEKLNSQMAPPRWECIEQRNTWYSLQFNRFPMNQGLTAQFPNYTILIMRTTVNAVTAVKHTDL